MMHLATVIALCHAFDAVGLEYWIDGGWGVDALLGRQTRAHSDLDLAVHFADLPHFHQTLTTIGFERVQQPQGRVWNPVFHHPIDGSIDLHGFVLNDVGEGVLGSPSENASYPSGALDGHGHLGPLQVRCIAAPFVLLFRNGFEPRDVDHHDVAALCTHFDLKRPSRFRA